MSPTAMNDRASNTLWVAISHHGFGHLGQMAPILNLLVRLQPNIHIIVQSGHPRKLLERFLVFAFVHIEQTADQPLLMKNAITLDIPATVNALKAYHTSAPNEIALLASQMQKHRVSLVISNVGYLPLVAAHQLDLPSIAFCSLNWADILTAYAHLSAELPPIIAVMKDYYAAADVFLAPEPFMPMPSMHHLIPVGPVARGGKAAPLATLLQQPPCTRYGLVSLGGIPYPLRYGDWPTVDGWRWIVSGVDTSRPDLIDVQKIPLEFTDVLASVDLLVTKPGYGNITEAGCAGIPVACLPRPDWPETEALLNWLRHKVPVLMIDEAQLMSGQCLPTVAQWRQTQASTLLKRKPQPAIATGVQEVVDYVLDKINV